MASVPFRLTTSHDRVLFALVLLLGGAGLVLGAVGFGKPALLLLLAGVPAAWLLSASPRAVAGLQRFVRTREEALGAEACIDGTRHFQAALVFVVLPAFWFFLSNDRSSSSGDTWAVLPTAASLVRQGNLEVGEYVTLASPTYYLADEGRLYCLVSRANGWYSGYALGMVPFGLPAATAQAVTGQPLRQVTLDRMEKWSASLLTALSLGLFFLIANRLSTPRTGLVATALLAVGSVFTTTLSQAIWQQSGVVFWSLLALWVEFQPGLRERPRGTAVQGLALGMLLACRLSSAVFVVAFGTWILLRAPRRAFTLAGVSLLCYAPWMLLYYSIYGTPFGPSIGHLLERGLWGENIPGGLAGSLFSPSRGLFVYQPWLILVPLGCWLGSSTSVAVGPRGWRLFILGFTALHLVVVASWRDWWGGHCWGSRLLAEVVAPLMLCALPALTLLLRTTPGRVILGVFFALAVLLHVREMYFATFWEGVYANVPATELIWSWGRAPFLTPPYRW